MANSKNKDNQSKGAGAPFANAQGLPEHPFGDNRVEKAKLEKELANGGVLVALKNHFSKEKNKENLIALLKCLKDSHVIVPMALDMSEKDAKRIASASEGEEIETMDARGIRNLSQSYVYEYCRGTRYGSSNRRIRRSSS